MTSMSSGCEKQLGSIIGWSNGSLLLKVIDPLLFGNSWLIATYTASIPITFLRYFCIISRLTFLVKVNIDGDPCPTPLAI